MSPAYVRPNGYTHTSNLCHDGDLQTYCLADNVQHPFLELVFPVTYVHKVLLVNRYCDDRDEATRRKIRERINGAQVDLMNGEDQNPDKIVWDCQHRYGEGNILAGLWCNWNYDQNFRGEN